MIHPFYYQSLLDLLLLLRFASFAHPLPRDLLRRNQSRVEGYVIAKAKRAVKLSISSYYPLADWAVVVSSQPASHAFDMVEMAAGNLQVYLRIEAKWASFLLLGLEAFTCVPSLIEFDLHEGRSLRLDDYMPCRVLNVGKK